MDSVLLIGSIEVITAVLGCMVRMVPACLDYISTIVPSVLQVVDSLFP